jgi:hypothetical protein
MSDFNPSAIPVSDYILKITGVFNYTTKFSTDAIRVGYNELTYSLHELKSYKDFFYPDFRKHFFSNQKSRHVILVKSSFEDSLIVLGNSKKSISISIVESRLDLFDDGFGLFSIDIKIAKEHITLADFSDASFFVRNFETELQNRSTNKWHEYIEDELLLGSKTRGEYINVDDYSGTKYKLYMIVDSPESLTTEQRDHLMIDLATVSQVGATGTEGPYSLDPNYYKKLLEKNAIAVYGNWKGLALLDTFTVFGSGILSLDWQKNTYSKTYYTIYLYCLFVKYSLFKFNYEIADLDEDRRTTFQQFMSKYYYNYISYNFLPTELFAKIKLGLDIENERNLLNQKIELVGKQIQEEQQDRTNKILGIVTVLTSLSSIETVYEYLLIGQKWLGWNAQIYWIVTITAALVIGAGVAFYVFGQTIIKWFKKRK